MKTSHNTQTELIQALCRHPLQRPPGIESVSPPLQLRPLLLALPGSSVSRCFELYVVDNEQNVFVFLYSIFAGFRRLRQVPSQPVKAHGERLFRSVHGAEPHRRARVVRQDNVHREVALPAAVVAFPPCSHPKARVLYAPKSTLIVLCRQHQCFYCTPTKQKTRTF